MTTQKKKKSAKEKRVLIGSVVVATAIVAGSTFAWFSSKDEVTNRLTASADYNVSIVEDFQPPKDWIPGQTVNKDVSAVNTGNVDAFVRMWLDGKLRLLKETAETSEPDATDAVATIFPTASFQKVKDPNRTKLGLNYCLVTETNDSKTITYFKELSTKQIENPLDENHGSAATSPTQEANHDPAAFSEVQSMQAAGVLAYAPDNSKYTWVLEQAADLWVLENNTATLKTVEKGTKVGSIGSTATVQVCPDKDHTSDNYYGPIDASTFKPESSGLYLFRRNIEDTADGTPNGYEYSGYYFVKKDNSGAPNALTGDTYFALHTEEGDNKHSDYVVPADSVSENTTSNVPTADQQLPAVISSNRRIRVFTASETVIDDTNDLTWTYDGSNKKFTVTTGNNPKDITIEIALANIGTDAEQWTAIGGATGAKTTFYYNNDLEAGDTTTKLVDSVKLDEDTEVGAYLAFDFDLNVYLDSVQVTLEEEGNESATTVSSGWAVESLNNDGNYDHSANVTPASGTATVTNGEITKIAWR